MTEQSWRAISLLSVGVSLALVTVLVLTYRKPRPVSQLLTGSYLVVIPFGVGVYLALTGVALDPLWLVGAAVLGLLLGWWQGSAGHLFEHGDRLYVQNAGWYLGAWGITCAVSQIVAALAGAMFPASVAALSLVVGSGSLWASKARLFATANSRVPSSSGTIS